MNENIGTMGHWNLKSSIQYNEYGFSDGYSLSTRNYESNRSNVSFLSTSDLTRGRPSSGTDPTDKTDDDSIVFERGIPQSLLSSPPQEMEYPFGKANNCGSVNTQSLDCVSEKLSMCKFCEFR